MGYKSGDVICDRHLLLCTACRCTVLHPRTRTPHVEQRLTVCSSMAFIVRATALLALGSIVKATGALELLRELAVQACSLARSKIDQIGKTPRHSRAQLCIAKN